MMTRYNSIEEFAELGRQSMMCYCIDSNPVHKYKHKEFMLFFLDYFASNDNYTILAADVNDDLKCSHLFNSYKVNGKYRNRTPDIILQDDNTGNKIAFEMKVRPQDLLKVFSQLKDYRYAGYEIILGSVFELANKDAIVFSDIQDEYECKTLIASKQGFFMIDYNEDIMQRLIAHKLR